MAKLFNTREAARKPHVSRQSLHTWVRQGRISAPAKMKLNALICRGWTLKHIQAARRARPRLGRKVLELDLAAITAMRERGLTWKAIAREFGVFSLCRARALQVSRQEAVQRTQRGPLSIYSLPMWIRLQGRPHSYAGRWHPEIIHGAPGPF